MDFSDVSPSANRRRLTLFFPVLFALSSAPAASAQQPTAARPLADVPKVQIRGTVVDDDDKPVAGATVSGVAVLAIRQGQHMVSTVGPIPERTTGDQGEFTVEVAQGDTGSTVALRARHGDAFTAKSVALTGEALGKPVTLKVSPRNARSVGVRVVGEEEQPITGAAVTVHRREWIGTGQLGAVPAPVLGSATPAAPTTRGGGPAQVAAPRGPAAGVTNGEGRFESPRNFEPDTGYHLEVTAGGYLTEKTPWKETGSDSLLSFGVVVLRRVHTLGGRIVDRQGVPVAGARVSRADGRRRDEATTDADGRFTLSTAFYPPGFLFVEKPGFRFHGQRCDRPEPVSVTLTRREEPAETSMTTVPPALPPGERRALANRLLEPHLRRVLEKGNDDARLRPLEALAKADPGRLLEELEKRPFKEAWFDSYLRRAAAMSLLAESHDEARTIIESMPDPGFRVRGYLDLYDARPAAARTAQLALLHQAHLHSRAVQENDHRVLHLAHVGNRLWALGEKDGATRLLREGHAIAKELPTAGWAGYARGAFAEDLALIDRDGALELMKDLKDSFEYVRHHGNMASKVAGADPSAAERVLGILDKRGDHQQSYQRDHYAMRVCYSMAPVDLPRARVIAESVKDPCLMARAYGLMAESLARSRPKEALELLDHAFAILADRAASGRDRFNNLDHAVVVAGILLPAAEQIDHALVPELLWRTVSFRPRQASPADDLWGMEAGSIGALALVVARYDHGLAMALVEEAERHHRPDLSGRPNHPLAAAIADPRRAVALAERIPEGRNREFAVESVVGLLASQGDAVWRAVYRTLGQWYVGDEDQ